MVLSQDEPNVRTRQDLQGLGPGTCSENMELSANTEGLGSCPEPVCSSFLNAAYQLDLGPELAFIRIFIEVASKCC